MPRYLVKRTFPGGLAVPADESGARAFAGVVATNAGLGVTWLHSYVSVDKQTMMCLYEGPDADLPGLDAGGSADQGERAADDLPAGLRSEG